MPGILPPKQSSCGQYHATMVSTCATWTQSRSEPISCTTGLVSPQYHCRFDDFFETVKLNGPDVTMSANWKHLAGFSRTDGTPTAPNPQATIGDVSIPPTEQSETAQNDPIEFVQEFEPDDDVNIHHDVPVNPMQDSEGATPTAPALPDAGTSSHGRQHKMSRAMAKSVSQQNFYGNRNMYYMAAQRISE